MKFLFIILMALTGFTSVGFAENKAQYLVSLRNAGNVGSSIIEFYNSNLVDFRYFISDRFDLGISIDQSENHTIEMSAKLEKLDPSKEIDSSGETTVTSFFTAFHPWGRKIKWNLDPYFGVGLKDYATTPTDVKLEDYYDLNVRTPEAIGIALKGGTHWFFHENWGVTADLEAGRVYANYLVIDRKTGIFDTFSTYTMTSGSVGISYLF